MIGIKASSVEENGDTVYLMLALSGDTSMSAVFCIPMIEWRNVDDAVAVKAITWTLRGKMLLTSPNRENSLQNDLPLYNRGG